MNRLGIHGADLWRIAKILNRISADQAAITAPSPAAR
jgi:hypothetical protein